jgi:hypothetical protein
MGVGGGDAAGVAGDDDAKSASHAQTADSGRAMDGMAGADPGVGGFEIENRRLGRMLVGRGVKRSGQAVDGFLEVEGDADYRTGSNGHIQSMADVGESFCGKNGGGSEALDPPYK